ncbi:UNVERIFIED_CONTAM: DNA-directed RNA polymerase subunit RPC12/RpoP [Paenibacillus sp. PvR008]
MTLNKFIFQVDCKCGASYIDESVHERSKWACKECNMVVFFDEERGMVNTVKGRARYMTNKYFVERKASSSNDYLKNTDSKKIIEFKEKIKEMESELKIKNTMISARDKIIENNKPLLDDLKKENDKLNKLMNSILSISET